MERGEMPARDADLAAVLIGAALPVATFKICGRLLAVARRRHGRAVYVP